MQINGEFIFILLVAMLSNAAFYLWGWQKGVARGAQMYSDAIEKYFSERTKS
jgi:hypothetical protein